MSTDNVSESAAELSRVSTDDSTGCIVQDVNTRNRITSTLQATAQAVASKGVIVLHSCSPPVNIPGVANDAYLISAVKALRLELLVGTPAIVEVAAQSTKATTAHLKANTMVCDLGLPCDASKNALNEQERLMLQACAAVHRELATDPAYHSDKGTFLPPIVISLPPFSAVYEEVIMILAAAGAKLTHVLFNQISLSADGVARWAVLLERYRCMICVDCWGYSCTFPVTGVSVSPADQQRAAVPFPSDEKSVAAVCALCAAGLTAHVTLSLAVYCRVQWAQYGGHGYGYLHDSVVPQIRARLRQHHSGEASAASSGSVTSLSQLAFADSTIEAIARSNLWRLFIWRPAPVLHDVAVQHLACHICAKLFVPGNHYSKFQFEYCSSACLATHRKADWK
jgi:hypothetical protein